MERRPSLMIPRLGSDPGAPFPSPLRALPEPDGLLAWGGDLDPLRLVRAYQHGIFPWYSEGQPILWWCPAERCVLPPAQIYVSQRLARLLRQQRFRVTADQAFAEVVAGCAAPRKSEPETWITAEMAEAYEALHGLGVAHSVEVWDGERLAGGLYGLSIGRMFFGESMFSRITGASKVAMVKLCRVLQGWNFALLDCQVSNPHLDRMGAVTMDRDVFLEILALAIDQPAPQESFSDAISKA